MVDLLPLRFVILDVVRWKKDIVRPLLSDLKRVTNLVKTRGLSVVMIDFPDACKVLDASLSSEYLDISKLPSCFRKGEGDLRTITLFRSLFTELFTQEGALVPDPDINAIFFLRQLLLLYKKVDKPCPQKNVEKAISEFVKIEQAMSPPSLDWHLDQLNTEDANVLSFHDGNKQYPLLGDRGLPWKLLEFLDRISRYVVNTFPWFDPMDIVPKHGPGAVSDLVTGRDKYQFPNWPKKLGSVFPYEEFGITNYSCYSDQLPPSDHEPPARLIAVPKTLKSPRLIASEPTSHQFLQQGLLKWIRANMRNPLSSSIDFTSQEKSREAALHASLDGSIATVDLSSASDRLSCWVVERFFRNRPDLLQALHAVRTRSVVIDKGPSSGCYLLKKYANQGSAVTFPLQSIIYASMCAAAICFERGYPFSIKHFKAAFSEVRVFGDDIIIPADCVYSLCRLLDYVGLKANMSKTHRSGHFRESCGIDAYRGYDITPMYLTDLSIREDFSGLSSWIDCSNVAYQKGLWSLSGYMVNCIPERYAALLPVSPRPLGCLYLRTTQKLTQTPNRTRWSKNHQMVEVQGLTARVRKRTGGRVGSQDLLHYFISEGEGEILPRLPIDALSISRKRSWGYRTVLEVRWVPAIAFTDTSR